MARTCGLRRTSSGVPSAISVPRLSTRMRSACSNTTSMSCSVKSTPIDCCRAICAVSRISSMRSRGAMPAIRHQRDLNVLTHGHGRKRRGDLEGASDAEPPDRAWFLARGVLAEQVDPAAVGNILAVEHIEACAFSGAVGTDQRQDVASLERERHLAHRMDAAIGFAQVLDCQQCWRDTHSAVSIPGASAGLDDSGLGASLRRRSLIVSSMPTMPLGNATTIRTMTPPSTSLDRSVWLTSQIESAL